MRRFSFVLVCAALLTGCCSHVLVDREVPPRAVVDGGTPLATFYVQNVSYQIFGVIPWCTGLNWTKSHVPFERANDWRIGFFADEVSLDNNIRTLKRACQEVGSNRISDLSHTANYDSLWSLFLVRRKMIKTSCFILK